MLSFWFGHILCCFEQLECYLEKIRDLPDRHPDYRVLALAIADAREDFTEARVVEVTA